MTWWLIGEAPTRTTTEPFVGDAARNLEKMIGFDFRPMFKLTNVLDTWPGPGHSKGARFPIGPAREGALRLFRRFEPGDRIVLVGGRVAERAFMIRKSPAYDWNVMYNVSEWGYNGGPSNDSLRTWVAWVPHPSRINMAWNDPANVLKMRSFFSDIRDEQEASR